MDALTLARWQFGITTVYHFFFVPLTLGLVWVVAVLQTAWYVDGRRGLEAPHEVLGQALPHQLRDGRRHRHRPGVPVRHELVRVLALRGRRLRRAARDRGAPRLLPRVDLPRALDLRLGQAAEEGAPRRRSGSSRSARTSPPSGSSSRTPSCSSRWATRCATAARRWRASGALITNPHVFVQFPHVITGAMATAAFFVLGISAWHLLRAKDEETRDAFRRSFRIGAVYAFVGHASRSWWSATPRRST